MSTPRDPDDETPGGQDDLSGGVSADEAAWRSIIDNYGDRPEIADEPEIEVPGSPRGAFPEDEPEPQEPVDVEEHFVPPKPPPLPLLPNWLGLILMVWFVGGFVYLVASMRPGAGDDYDDGAVL